MSTRHLKFWPSYAAYDLTAPATNLYYNAEVSAQRYPNKPFIVFYDTTVSFAGFHDETQRIAGFLERRCGIGKGDRVLLLMQNSPQFIIGYYGILRANAVVVPLNPMNLSAEILKFAQDAGSRTILVSQELYARVEPLLQSGALKHAVVAAYSDYLKEATTLSVPDFVAAPRAGIERAGVTLWKDALAANLQPGPLTAGPDDLSVIAYTSGTTGLPKGVMHSHRTVMHTAVGSLVWFAVQADLTLLAVAPLFHVTGMQGSMNGPLYFGCTIVLLPRWDRDTAARCVERYRISSWTAVPTMIQDFFLNPKLHQYDVSSIRRLSGGGAAMPAAVAQRLQSVGVTYLEGYGLTETMAATHLNPPEHPKMQCLGIPSFGVDSRIIDPVTLQELPPGESGEIIMHGPQVMLGYWNKPEDTAKVFLEIDGKRFFRSGDLGKMDEDGYFFIVDRLKRMINASGFKVWPTEVESLMYQHPAVQEACVIGTKDAHRGETVKAVIVLKPEFVGKTRAQDLSDWARDKMAAYKVPRVIQFVDELPKSGSGKIMWRELQDLENAATSTTTTTPTHSARAPSES
jgi:fatty-acyl-CoA synthase